MTAKIIARKKRELDKFLDEADPNSIVACIKAQIMLAKIKKAESQLRAEGEV